MTEDCTQEWSHEQLAQLEERLQAKLDALTENLNELRLRVTHLENHLGGFEPPL